jgi:hypothetical protein
MEHARQSTGELLIAGPSWRGATCRQPIAAAAKTLVYPPLPLAASTRTSRAALQNVCARICQGSC